MVRFILSCIEDFQLQSNVTDSIVSTHGDCPLGRFRDYAGREKPVIRVADIAGLRTAAEDFQETERLKADLKRLRKEREPFFLTKNDLTPIFKWKLRDQSGRVKRHLEKNSKRSYESITRAAFSIRDDDWKVEAELRIGVLTVLHGVGVPVASAILALADPDHYCVVDRLGWRAVFGKERTAFDVRSYISYLSEIRLLAEELGWSAQETDLAVWEYARKPRRVAMDKHGSR
jgi:hypothetical protein